MAKKKTDPTPAPIQEPEILAPALPETAIVVSEGAIVSFLREFALFATKATALERQSSEILVKAKALDTQRREYETAQKPWTGDEDALVQALAIDASAHVKAVTAHWGVTALFHNIHTQLTAGRSRGHAAASEAKTLMTSLHTTYVLAEERRVAEERERTRRDEQRQAEEQRARDLAVLEQQALDAEAASPDLSDREQAFVDYFKHGDPDPKVAARSAGYKDWQTMAARLMAMPKIAQAVELARQAVAARRQAEAVAAQPVEVRHAAPAPKADVHRLGTSTKTTSGEVYDETAFILACLDPKQRLALGIPTDVLTIVQGKMTDYARQMGEAFNKWPGCRLKVTVSTR